jgi:hypothetical protein
MTNDEKANEIARDMLPYNNAEYHACYNSAMKAMKWKDEQFAKVKKEIDEQWKRLMAESKSIGVDLLQCKDEQKPDWNDYDMVVIDAIYNTLNHCGVTKCGLEVTEMLEWLEELEKQGKRNNIVEQLTAFAVHLQKRGAFRDDLCMDFEHEAQSFIEMQNNKEL